jgi:hypothetical protein
VALAGDVVDEVLRRAALPGTGSRDDRVWELSRDLHRAIDATPEDMTLFLAELATRCVESGGAAR